MDVNGSANEAVMAAKAIMSVAVNTWGVETVPNVTAPHCNNLRLRAFDLRQRHRLGWDYWNYECGRKCRHRKHELDHVPLRGLLVA
jgi:hypothetical protein